jgi:hypothetical protein
MIANALAGVVNAANVPFCVGEKEKREAVNHDPNYIDNVATQLSQLCGRMALEDAVRLLEMALDKLDCNSQRRSL